MAHHKLSSCAFVIGALLLASCGGAASPPSGGDGAGAPTIGLSGGRVAGPDGAEVFLPPGAIETPVTVRMAKDATGMPALPAGVVAVGDVFSLTPHGAAFAEAAQVRLPSARRLLLADEELMVAKISPGGDWELIPPEVSEGALTVPVEGFSWLVPVARQYQQPILAPAIPPLAVAFTALTCDGGPCSGMRPDSTEVLLEVASNQGVTATACAGASIEVASVSTYTNGSPGGAPSLTLTPIAPLGQALDGSASYGFRFLAQVARATRPDTGARVATSADLVLNLRCAGNPATTSRLLRTTLQFPAKTAGQVVAPEFGLYRIATSCNGGPCSALSGPQQVRMGAVVGGRGYLPAPCTPPAHLALTRAFSVDTLARSEDLRTTANPPVDDAATYAIGSAGSGFTIQPPVPLASVSLWVVLRCANGWARVVGGTELPFGAPSLAVAASFFFQPSSVVVREGQTAGFFVSAQGLSAPTLQWQRRTSPGGAWVDIAGATTFTFTTPPVSPADSGTEYRVVATNELGPVASDTVRAILSTEAAPPVVVVQPAPLAVVTGSEAVFAVVARGTEALSYQWRRDGVPILAANAATLKLPAVTAADAAAYSVVVSNGAGTATSQAAALRVGAEAPAIQPPTIVTQPAAVLVEAGSTATFAVGVAGTGPFGFQWRKDGAPLAGATAAALTLAGVGPAQAGVYAVVVTNAAGSATSSGAALTVQTTTGPAPVAPTITTQPATVVVAPGGSATLAVAAQGSGPLTYQWRRGGVDVAGATAAALTLTAIDSQVAGSYTVLVANEVGRLTSSAAQVLVLGTPAITLQPAGATVAEGGAATFGVTATGDHLRYQWLRDGLAIEGATDPVHSTLATTLADGGAVYAVLVYNGAGLVQSLPAVLTVTAPPVVAGPAQAGKLAAGAQHTCAVRADASLACWGDNSSGQIGNGVGDGFVKSPFLLPLSGAVTAVAAGRNATCAIHGPGDLSCWGNSDRSPVPVAGFTGVRAVSVGSTHRCLVTSGGTVYCWGSNTLGELGDATFTPSSVPVQALGAGNAPVSGVVALAAGFHSTCALKASGSVLCWGGAIGFSASPVAGLTSVTALAQGELRPCALSTDGLVRCWSGAAVPQVVAGLTGVTALASGNQHTCAAREDGSLWCWGTGLMGNGNISEVQATPQPVAGLGGVGVVAAGAEHTCALRTAGTLTCWGANTQGQLATGDTLIRTVPTDLAAGTTWWRP